MFAIRLLGLALACAPFSAAVAADYVAIEQRLTAEQFAATGLDRLSAEQLALLNTLLREDSERAVEAVKAETAAAVRAEATPAPPAGDSSRYIGLQDEPIASRVKGTVTGWDEGTEFVLENGQVWKVLKGHLTLRKPMESPQVRVIPGIAGRWFLEVHEDFPKARVYRID